MQNIRCVENGWKEFALDLMRLITKEGILHFNLWDTHSFYGLGLKEDTIKIIIRDYHKKYGFDSLSDLDKKDLKRKFIWAKEKEFENE